MRKHTRSFLAVALVVVLLPTTSVGVQEDADPNRLTITLSDPDRPATVQVRALQSNITVNAHAGRDVIITADDDVFAPNPGAQGLRRLTAGGGFVVDEENNVVSIRSNRFDSTNLSIQVPTRTNLQIESTIGGIDIGGIDGDIEVTSMNDNITLTNIAGSVVAHSQNGDLHVTMTRVTQGKPMAFSSVNGNVDVTLPASTGANLSMSTINGDVYTDFDIEIEIQGDGRIFQPNFPGQNITGTINGGGPVFELQTVNGSIFVRNGS